jgi:hypothetical protein
VSGCGEHVARLLEVPNRFGYARPRGFPSPGLTRRRLSRSACSDFGGLRYSGCCTCGDECDQSLDFEERDPEDARPNTCLDQRPLRQTPIWIRGQHR